MDAEQRTKRKKIQRQLDSFFNKPVNVEKGIMSRHCKLPIYNLNPIHYMCFE